MLEDWHCLVSHPLQTDVFPSKSNPTVPILINDWSLSIGQGRHALCLVQRRGESLVLRGRMQRNRVALFNGQSRKMEDSRIAM